MSMNERVPLAVLPGLDRHVLEPLKAAGYEFLDQVEPLSAEQLFRLVHGEKSLGKLLHALNRDEDFQKLTGKYSVEVKDAKGKTLGSVPIGELRKIVAVQGTARALGFASPDNLRKALSEGRFTWEEVAAYKLRRNAERYAEPVAAPSEDDENGLTDAESQKIQAAIDEIVKQYEADYDTRLWTKADFDDVKMLASLTVSVRTAQDELLHMASGARSTQMGKNLSDQIGNGLAQIQRLKESLQISLKARVAQQTTSEAHEVITQFASDAKALLRDWGSVCVHCGIRLGVCVCFFPRHLKVTSVQITCPQCGELVDWPLVTDRMLASYVEAAEFVPENAPEGVFK